MEKIKLKDYICTPSDSGEAILQIIREMESEIPSVYMKADLMVRTALKIKERRKEPFVILPFCHTVEGEAMGADINYGDYNTGPRCGKYKAYSIDYFKNLKMPSFNEGRIFEVIKAVEILSKMGETVLYELSGPFTILNTLMDASIAFKTQRKNPEGFKTAMNYIEEMLLEFSQRIINSGAKIISYADSAGGLNIIGPSVSKKIAEEFTLPFLGKLIEKTKGKCIIHLCPKTFWLLESLGVATCHIVETNSQTTYGQLIVDSIGKIDFLGDRCLNLMDTKAVPGKVRGLKLNIN